MRQVNYDALRGLAAMLVIGTHAAANALSANLAHPNLYFSIASFYTSFTRMAVPLFVMLSGAFVLNDFRNEDFASFYRKSWKKIVMPTLWWSLGYILFRYVFLLLSLKNGLQVDLLSPLKRAVLGEPYYHMWYMYMLIGMYALVPVLIRLRKEWSSDTFLRVGIGLALLSIPIDYFSHLYWPVQWILYLGYFMIGASFRREAQERSLRTPHASLLRHKPWLYALIALSVIFSSYLLVEWGVRAGWDNSRLFFYRNQSPTILIAALATFLCFANWETDSLKPIFARLISRIAAQSFFIYLIHAGLLHLLLYFLMRMHLHPSPLYFIPLSVIGIFVLSFALGEGIDYFRKKMKKLPE